MEIYSILGIAIAVIVIGVIMYYSSDKYNMRSYNHSRPHMPKYIPERKFEVRILQTQREIVNYAYFPLQATNHKEWEEAQLLQDLLEELQKDPELMQIEYSMQKDGILRITAEIRVLQKKNPGQTRDRD